MWHESKKKWVEKLAKKSGKIYFDNDRAMHVVRELYVNLNLEKYSGKTSNLIPILIWWKIGVLF